MTWMMAEELRKDGDNMIDVKDSEESDEE